MNIPLKVKIIENYGSQWKFASVLKIDDSIVSKVVRERKPLADAKKRLWAQKLKCGVEDIFPC